MTATPADEIISALQYLPSVDELLRSETVRPLIDDLGRPRVTALARKVIDELRRELSQPEPATFTKESVRSEAERRLMAEWEAERRLRSRRVINATGVVIHTNLGRAPLSEPARRSLMEAAGYCNVEYDIAEGKRGRRGSRVEAMLTELTGAEGALVVNNCAAAAFFVLSGFAAGREVVISRGELVEIGGDFRVPDVLKRSGAVLKEVGTTNRTKLIDYERAIGESTAMILRVHPSNYRIVGYTATPSLAELAGLARRSGLLLYEDAGSGALTSLNRSGIVDEPVIRYSIEAGADIVTFSGDKLLGGPQAGIIAGRSKLIEGLRRDPLYRALRVDKLAIAALEATLEDQLRGNAEETIPVLKMLSANAGDLSGRAARFIEKLTNRSLKVELASGQSAVGGGSAPTAALDTTLITVTHAGSSPDKIEELLRMAEIPIITRIAEGKLVIDLRTVEASEESHIAAALNGL